MSDDNEIIGLSMPFGENWNFPACVCAIRAANADNGFIWCKFARLEHTCPILSNYSICTNGVDS